MCTSTPFVNLFERGLVFLIATMMNEKTYLSLCTARGAVGGASANGCVRPEQPDGGSIVHRHLCQHSGAKASQSARIDADNEVTQKNVPSRRSARHMKCLLCDGQERQVWTSFHMSVDSTE